MCTFLLSHTCIQNVSQLQSVSQGHWFFFKACENNPSSSTHQFHLITWTFQSKYLLIFKLQGVGPWFLCSDIILVPEANVVQNSKGRVEFWQHSWSIHGVYHRAVIQSVSEDTTACKWHFDQYFSITQLNSIVITFVINSSKCMCCSTVGDHNIVVQERTADGKGNLKDLLKSEVQRDRSILVYESQLVGPTCG